VVFHGSWKRTVPSVNRPGCGTTSGIGAEENSACPYVVRKIRSRAAYSCQEPKVRGGRNVHRGPERQCRPRRPHSFSRAGRLTVFSTPEMSLSCALSCQPTERADRDVEEFGGVPWRPDTRRALARALCGHEESAVQHRCRLAGCGDNQLPLCGMNRVVPSRRRLGQLRPKLSTGQHVRSERNPLNCAFSRSTAFRWTCFGNDKVTCCIIRHRKLTRM
jgi:hypothetical protein